MTMTFIYSDEDGERIEHSLIGPVMLPDLLDRFAQFVKGCGYHVPDHHELEFVPCAGMEPETDDESGA